MIDFTTIQVEAIPPKISTLQKTNLSLKGQNKALTNILIITGLVTVGVIIYHINKRYKEDEERKRRSS